MILSKMECRNMRYQFLEKQKQLFLKIFNFLAKNRCFCTVKITSESSSILHFIDIKHKITSLA